MVNTLRRFSQPIMILVAVVVVISFVWWQPSFVAQTGSGGVIGPIYGEMYSKEQFQRVARKLDVHRLLGGDFISAVSPQFFRRGLNSADTATAIVLEREMDRMGIDATESEISDYLQTGLRNFAGPDGFNAVAFQRFVETELPARGFTQGQIDGMLRDEVRAKKLKELIGRSVAATPTEVQKRLLDQRLKTEASYVAVKFEEIRKEMQAMEEELKAAFEVRKAGLKTEPKRRVKYAAFLLPPPPEGKPYEAVKRNELMQSLADRAYTFREGIEGQQNFEEEAKKAGAVVGETAQFFTQDDPPSDEVLEESPEIAKAAFAITKEKPYSEVISAAQGLQKGAYVIAFLEDKPAQPMTFDEAKTVLDGDVKTEKSVRVLLEKASTLAAKIREAKKTGKSFYEAAEAAGEKALPFPAFTGQIPPQGAQYAAHLIPVAMRMAPGEVSLPVPAGQDLIIVHVDQRIADEKDLEAAKPSIAAEIEGGFSPFPSGRRAMAYYGWLEERIKASGVAALNFN